MFTVGDALARGVTADRLRSSDLETAFHGIRTRGRVPVLRAYAPRLRSGDRFSHTTAAQLWGAPLPRAREGEVHVAAFGRERPRARGCIGHESNLGESVARYGLPSSGPAQTVIECATTLELDDVVAICDFLVLDPRVLDPLDVRPHISRAELGRELRERRGSGVRNARRAFALCRDGVESPMETRLRLLLTRAGVPEPTCGFELRRQGGTSIGWFDLAWPDLRVIAEYDGDGHRTSTSQYERDIRRFDEATEEGWRVIRVRKRGVLVNRDDTIARVERALRESAVENRGSGHR